MYDMADVEFAVDTVSVLSVVLVVAIVAFGSRSRVVFFAGLLGSCLGFVVPEPQVHMQGTLEGCFMESLKDSASHILFWGIIGAGAACVAVAVVQIVRTGRIPRQYSLRTLFLVMTVVAVMMGMVRFLTMCW